MKIYELFEERKPATFVAGRDFKLIPNTKYNGYVLGVYTDEDKPSYGVYKQAGSQSFQHAGRDLSNDEYTLIHTVVDPSTGRLHSPYLRGADIKGMYKYTVDQLKSGKLQPETVEVASAEGPEGDDIDPQGLPGQPMDQRTPPKMDEAFYLRVDDMNAIRPHSKDSTVVWIKKTPDSEWKIHSTENSAQAAQAIAKRMSLATRAKLAVGNKVRPAYYADGETVMLSEAPSKKKNLK